MLKIYLCKVGQQKDLTDIYKKIKKKGLGVISQAFCLFPYPD
jgi:uncharacterized protein YfkK (UPF0435 family)